ncbi:transportin MOS14 isoform X2 [Physcomitrium patens]|uniref:Exportin-1/Importin-beta-like domain-containing protein n=1 Tax=Physcomitrium patens TaxID=3218 RepID=A0A7I4F4U0_PHYPA|nr:transportin MOS14-like isoform X3 [Physcomitrium patens]|eukprot:XP_024393612.1 transportin MOS14-like isoform X3 [Physcomitrella patens]
MESLQAQVVQAVRILNHDTQSVNRVAANQWLVQFQNSDAAWEVATSIMSMDSSPTIDLEVELFAGQVLKRKIQCDVGKLSLDGRAALQKALLMSAKKFSNGPSQLLTQICVALSALVLRAAEVRKPVERLFASLNELQGQGTGSNAVLELLTVLPEEVVDDQSLLSSVEFGRRSQFSREILSHTGAVLEFLLQQSISDGLDKHNRRSKVLRCLLSWVRLGCFLEIPQSAIPSHPLLGFVYSSLQDPGSFELAVEVLTELVSRHEGLPQVLLPRMLDVKDGLLMPALAAGEENVIRGVATLIAELGQAAPALVAQGSREALDLAESLLRCVSFPSCDWEIAESTLQFWCTLAEYLVSCEDTSAALPTFIPVYSALLEALIVRAQVPDQIEEGSFAEDDLDGVSGLPGGLALFRKNLDEPLVDVCRLLGPKQFLASLLSGAEAWSQFETPVPWRSVEARLFALHTASEVVLSERQILDITPVLHLIVVLPSRSSQIDRTLFHLIQKSAAEVVASYSGWLHNFPSFVTPLLAFLASGLTVPVAVSSCAAALRKVCEDSPNLSHESTSIAGLLRIGEELHALPLTLEEEEDVMCAIGRVLSSLTSVADLNAALEHLLKPSHVAIETLLSTDSDNSLRHHSKAYWTVLQAGIRAVHRIGVLFGQLTGAFSTKDNGDEPVLRIIAHFWPLFERLLTSRHMEDSSLASATCKSLSQAIQASAGIAVEEFGQEKEHGALIVETLMVLTSSEAMAAMTTSYSCDQEPELAEVYFGLMSTFVHSCPHEVVAAADTLLEISFNRASICCTAMHRGAALAAMSYMSNFLEVVLSAFTAPRSVSLDGSFLGAAARVCLQCGENVVSGMMYALLGVSAITRVNKATIILQQLSALCYFSANVDSHFPLNFSTLQGWLVSAVQGLPPEYLKPGEVETLIPIWLKAMEAAAGDVYRSKASMNSGGRASGGGYLQGAGGRMLKRLLREFADTHRFTAPSYGPS